MPVRISFVVINYIYLTKLLTCFPKPIAIVRANYAVGPINIPDGNAPLHDG